MKDFKWAWPLVLLGISMTTAVKSSYQEDVAGAVKAPEVLNKENPDAERVFVLPIDGSTPPLMGVFSQQGQLLYSLPSGSQPYTADNIAPFKQAVLNRLIIMPDSMLIWATQYWLKPIEGVGAAQIMRATRCVDSRNDIANHLYWDPGDNFCACYRMRDDTKQKFYLRQDGSLVNQERLSVHSGPMQEGLALVRLYDEQLENGFIFEDDRLWHVLREDGSLTLVDLPINRVYSAFHQGRALVSLQVYDNDRNVHEWMVIIDAEGQIKGQVDQNILLDYHLNWQVATTGHGYFVVRKSDQADNNNFAIIDLEGQVLKIYEGISDLQLLGPELILIKAPASSTDATAEVRLEDLNSEVEMRWSKVRKIMPVTSLEDGLLLAVGDAENPQLLHIDQQGSRLHKLPGVEGELMGPDQYMIRQDEFRNRWTIWTNREGQIHYDSRWMTEEQSWPLSSDVPVWPITQLRVVSDAAGALQQLDQMTGLKKLSLPILDRDQRLIIRRKLLNLSELEIGRISVAQLSTMLNKVPELTQLSINYLTQAENAASLPVLDKLEELQITVRGSAALYAWLSQLPRLKRLKIAADKSDFLDTVHGWRALHSWEIQTEHVFFDDNFGPTRRQEEE